MSTETTVSRQAVQMPRRSALALGLAAGAGILRSGPARADSKIGGAKITALYGAPKSPEEFEKHYLEIHMPMIYAVKGIKHIELAMPVPGPDGKPPAFYRVTEIWFETMEDLKKITTSPEWKRIREDVPKFATGGVTRLVAPIG